MTIHAIVPVKEFSRAKSRLGGLLNAAECAVLARAMCRDVIAALRGVPAIAGVTLLGHGRDIARLAAETGCRHLCEHVAGLNHELRAAAGRLEKEGAATLLVVPADLPYLGSSDIEKLLARHDAGLTICPAESDGGTNALVISPPTAIDFSFGTGSAQRHTQSAQDAGIQCRRVEPAALRRDIDTPEDLVRLCRGPAGRHTSRYLAASGICDRALRHTVALTA